MATLTNPASCSSTDMAQAGADEPACCRASQDERFSGSRPFFLLARASSHAMQYLIPRFRRIQFVCHVAFGSRGFPLGLFDLSKMEVTADLQLTGGRHELAAVARLDGDLKIGDKLFQCSIQPPNLHVISHSSAPAGIDNVTLSNQSRLSSELK